MASVWKQIVDQSSIYKSRIGDDLRRFVRQAVEEPPELAMWEEIALARDFLGYKIQQYDRAREAHAKDPTNGPLRALYEHCGSEMLDCIERVQKLLNGAVVVKNAMRKTVSPEEVSAIANRILGILTATVNPLDSIDRDKLIADFQLALTADLQLQDQAQQRVLEGTKLSPVDEIVLAMDETIPKV